jgi:hypothetical protein
LILFQSLVAMMVNTYETTNEYDREWIRQVFKQFLFFVKI